MKRPLPPADDLGVIAQPRFTWPQWKTVRLFVVPWMFLRGDDRITGMGCQFLTALGLAIPIVTGGLIGLAPPFTETFDRDADLAAVFSGYQWPVLGYLLSFVLTYGLLATLFWAAHVQDRRRRGGRAAASRRGPGIAAAAWLGLLLLTLVLPVGTGPML